MTPNSLTDRTKTTKTERGIINGVAYRFFYSDGSGSFEGGRANGVSYDAVNPNWKTYCFVDPISDAKACKMSINNLGIVVSQDGRENVLIGSDHFPGSEIVVRIDGETPIRAAAKFGFGAGTAKRIIERLKTAKKVATRYQEWPNSYVTDRIWELYGYRETLSYIRWAVKHIR